MIPTIEDVKAAAKRIEGIAVISVVAALIGNLWRLQAAYRVLFQDAPVAAPVVKSAAE